MNLYEDFLRADTVSRVNRYVARSGVDYGEAWRRLRNRLTELTGYTAPKTAKNKLAAIHEAGHLELVHKLAGELR